MENISLDGRSLLIWSVGKHSKIVCTGFIWVSLSNNGVYMLKSYKFSSHEWWDVSWLADWSKSYQQLMYKVWHVIVIFIFFMALPLLFAEDK